MELVVAPSAAPSVALEQYFVRVHSMVVEGDEKADTIIVLVGALSGELARFAASANCSVTVGRAVSSTFDVLTGTNEELLLSVMHASFLDAGEIDVLFKLREVQRGVRLCGNQIFNPTSMCA